MSARSMIRKYVDWALEFKHSYIVMFISMGTYFFVAHFFGKEWRVGKSLLDQDLYTVFSFGGVFHLILSFLFSIVCVLSWFQIRYLRPDPFGRIRSPRLFAFATTVMLPISIMTFLLALFVVLVA